MKSLGIGNISIDQYKLILSDFINCGFINSSYVSFHNCLTQLKNIATLYTDFQQRNY